jgi:NADH-quinone oxidoreductase subunit A
MVGDYTIVGIFLLLGTVFVLITLGVAKLVRPSRPSKVKLQNYECGETPVGSSWIQYNVGYYIFALIFVIFDVEVVFLFPWAVAFGKLGLFALLEMFIFLLILIFGLVYAWRKGALKWV